MSYKVWAFLSMVLGTYSYFVKGTEWMGIIALISLCLLLYPEND